MGAYRSYKNVRRFDMEAESLRRQAEDQAAIQAAIARLSELDPEGWEAWYDDDENIPEVITDYRLRLLLEKRVKELEADCSCSSADAAGVGLCSPCPGCADKSEDIPFVEE